MMLETLNSINMEVKFRQPSIGWCTVYMLANILNDKDIIGFTKYEDFKGCGAEQVDEILMSSKPSIKMVGLLGVDNKYPPLPKPYIWQILNQKDDHEDLFENQVAPYSMTVRIVNAEIWHSVAVLRHKDNLYYLDPYKENWIHVRDLEHFETLFIDCHHIERPHQRHEKAWVSFDGDHYEYPFLTPNQKRDE